MKELNQFLVAAEQDGSETKVGLSVWSRDGSRWIGMGVPDECGSGCYLSRIVVVYRV